MLPNFDRTDDFRSLLSCLIRVGEVSSVDAAAGTARVVFDDEDSLVSYSLQVLRRNTFANKDYGMPDVGEDVVCLFLPSGTEEGFILGSVYAGDVSLPESSGDKRTVQFSDSTRVSYDRTSHELDVEVGNTKIHADQDGIQVNAPQQIDQTAGAAINLTAPVITLTMGSTTMKLNGSKAQIKTQELEFVGNMTVTGSIHSTGNISTSGNVSASGVVSGSNL